MAANQLSLAAMGRPFTLGALYNQRSESIITGIKIWSKREIEERVQRQSSTSSSAGFEKDSSLADKAEKCDINGELMLSLLSGSIRSNGSGKYFSETKTTKNTESVTYKIEVKTDFEELGLSPQTKLKNFRKLQDATHVVTGIQYGGTAFFTFERSTEDSTSKSRKSGTFGAQLSAFCSVVQISGSANVDISDEEKKAMEKIRVIYRGDFHLDSVPTSFVEALKSIRSIKSHEARSPITVYLTPLSFLTDAEDPPAVRLLSSGCLNSAIGCYETLNGVLGTLDETISSLRSTPWTGVVKTLERESRQLAELKKSLDAAVKAGLLYSTARSGTELGAIENGVDEACRSISQKPLQTWIDGVADSSRTLVDIWEKVLNLGVGAITLQSEKVRFVMDSLENEQLLISATCPVQNFCLSNFNDDGVRLWPKEQEAAFYTELATVVRQCQNLSAGPPMSHSRSSSDRAQFRAAMEQAETPGDKVSFRVMKYRDGEVSSESPLV